MLGVREYGFFVFVVNRSKWTNVLNMMHQVFKVKELIF